MKPQLVIHGIPDRLRLDGWWLSSKITPKEVGKTARQNHKTKAHLGISRFRIFYLIAGLIALSDWLFWQQKLGASIAIFALVLGVAMLVARLAATARKHWVRAIAIIILANLPMLEQFQALSIFFSISGIAALAIWQVKDEMTGWGQSLRLFLKVTFTGPLRFLMAVTAGLGAKRIRYNLTKQAASWLLPIGFGIVFMGFFILANPFLAQVFLALLNIEFIAPNTLARMLFWLGAAALIWPYLNLSIFLPRLRNQDVPSAKAPPQRFGLVVNPVSVRMSLILFNGIFALQTGLDLLVLSGGMALPEGLTYASYAHRGAYPLVATALLAGGFAIGTRKLITQDRLLRGLVYAWLLQNLFLVLSAAFRLNLYIETYALTHLRVAAFIWMLLVFVGLVLVAVQIAQNKSNIWLMNQNLIALLLALYTSSFVNFAPMIARYNIAHPLKNGQVDARYICRLGPQALPVILAQGPDFCAAYVMPKFTPMEGWRDWGFRNARLAGYLEAKAKAEAP